MIRTIKSNYRLCETTAVSTATQIADSGGGVVGLYRLGQGPPVPMSMPPAHSLAMGVS